MSIEATSLAQKVQSPADIDGRMKALPEWNHRILIVEDEVGIAEAYRDILDPRGGNILPMARSSRSSRSAAPVAGEVAKPANEQKFDLVVVNDAESAIAEVKRAVAQKKPFTMGFFDVLLGGGMDGIELVKKLHEIDSTLYAVFATAYSDRNVDSIQALLGTSSADRWDYLNKPFTQGEILQKARSGVAVWKHEARKTD